MKKRLILFFLLLFPLLLFAACKGGEEEKPKVVTQTREQILQEKRDAMYRELVHLKDDVVNGNLDDWRMKLDAIWMNGDIIDSIMTNYMNEIQQIALRKENEMKNDNSNENSTTEPEIDPNFPVTKELLEIYLREILAGITDGTLKNWETYLDRVYLYGDKLVDSHYEIIKQIETKGAELNQKQKGK